MASEEGAQSKTEIAADSHMARDTIYKTAYHPVEPFRFDHRVARVFDDMIHRSVPCYREIIERQVQLIACRHTPGTRIYDLGCSTGNVGLALCRRHETMNFSMIAVDSSEAMLARYRKNLREVPRNDRIHLICQDIFHTDIKGASVVVLNYTLQFLPLEKRLDLMRAICNGLEKDGILLLCEKVTHGVPELAGLQNCFYHAFKRENGYSELEISQKRDALEKVLIPETVETHLARLQQAGFGAVDMWHKWFNFAAFIAVK
jgi:tRNA (cmo5U34)-methyltransferase